MRSLEHGGERAIGTGVCAAPLSDGRPQDPHVCRCGSRRQECRCQVDITKRSRWQGFLVIVQVQHVAYIAEGQVVHIAKKADESAQRSASASATITRDDDLNLLEVMVCHTLGGFQMDPVINEARAEACRHSKTSQASTATPSSSARRARRSAGVVLVSSAGSSGRRDMQPHLRSLNQSSHAASLRLPKTRHRGVQQLPG